MKFHVIFINTKYQRSEHSAEWRFYMKYLLKYKKTIIIFFVILTAVCSLMSLRVGVDYNLMDYLPDESPSTIALNVMNEQFEKGAPNARVMIPDVEIPDAVKYKEKMKNVEGVKEVTWLDDSVNVFQPLEFIDSDLLDDYYKDKNALFTLTIDEDYEEAAIDDIRAIVGNDAAISGSAADNATAVKQTTKEINVIIVVVVILVFIILVLTTTSYFEPVLFLITIGVAIMINRGTNLMFGTISFVTNAAGSILQLAVSMDYSIFLIHRFAEMREIYPDVNEAMAEAVKKSTGSVMSSGLTTVMGFAALILMKFKIGPDMGWVMSKSIVISLVSVLGFLPALTLATYKYIDKTQHKPFVRPPKKLGDRVFRVRVPLLIAIVILFVPSYLAQNNNSFTYGSSGIYGAGTKLGDDTALIEKEFGKSNQMVLMVPINKTAKEKALGDELKAEEKITSVISFTETAGVTIPEEMVEKDTLSQLVSDKYSRFVLTVDTDVEGTEAFEEVEKIRSIAEKYYGNTYLLVGQSVNSYDMRDVVTSDNTKVNFLAVASIALILLINFKSLTIPFILLAVIELSTWLNLSFPYFADKRLFYIGYLIISSIQLGATVDYAILYADRYIENRAKMKAAAAAKQSLSETVLSILTSASILTLSGIKLGLFSTNGVISQLGTLVGRGGILSAILVLFGLPVLLVMFDGLIYKTTYKLDFYGKGKDKNEKV